MADTETLDHILKTVRIRVPGALDSVLYLELFNVLDQFFKATNVWQEDINFPVLTTRTLYEIESNDLTAQVIRVITLTLADRITPVRHMMQIPGILTLLDYPQAAGTYYATVALSVAYPLAGSLPEIPDEALRHHREPITNGLLAALYSQPAKPYSNDRLALFHGREFRNGMNSARVDSMHANIYSGQRWRFPQSFASRRK